MTASVIRSAAAAILIVMCWGAAAPARGETKSGTLTPPGERLIVTPTGVDMRSGQYTSSVTDLSIGEDSATGGLALTRSMNANVPGHINPFANFSHNWDVMISQKSIDIDEANFNGGIGPDLRAFVHFGGRSETFDARGEQGVFTQTSNNPMTRLTFTGTFGSAGAVYTYSARDGTTALFRAIGNGDCSSLRWCAYVSRIDHPDGTRFDFEYASGAGPTRLRAVISNRGYALLLQYGSGADANHIVSACVINLAVQVRPTDNSCPASPPAATAYSYTTFESKRRLASATDAGGGVWSFTYARVSGALRIGFLRPGDTGAWLTNTLTERQTMETLDELVDSQTFADGSSWTYSRWYAPQAEGEIAQVAGGYYVDPAGGTTSVEFGFIPLPIANSIMPLNVGDLVWQITPGPVTVTDPLGRISTGEFGWDAGLVGPVRAFTDPEGAVTELTYDGWSTRNVTQVRRNARPGSDLADIVTSATHVCTIPLLCARPTSTTDARGKVTNYTYDSTHGGLLTETGPAPADGAPRPQTRHSYAQRTAWISNGTGGYVQAPPIWVRTETSMCQTSAATGNPAAPCATSGDEVRTTYDYGPDSGPNSLLLRGTLVTGTGISARSCYTYDARGRRIGETTPNAGLSSCPASQTSAQPFTANQRFDAMGRVTGTISADPDGGGALPFRAVRNSYDAAGRLLKAETGTLSAWQSESVAPANWGAAFSIVRTIETQYDSMGRKTRDSAREGAAGTVLTVTQYSYDVMGRLTCAAVRMNPAAFGSLPPSACDHSTYDTAKGRDRINRSVYDAAGQRIQLREGVGVDGEEAAEATWAYNLNGQVTTVIDGNGNRAELRYDGHGRQNCWMFPSTARATAYNDATQATALASANSLSGGTTNGHCTSGDYEAYQYDPNGNRTSLRKRDNTTLTYQYDDLNRMIVKTVPERPAPHPFPLTPAQTRDVYYSYDLRGLQLSARFDSQSGEGVTFTYDALGRRLTETGPLGTMTSLWDVGGRRTRLTAPAGYWVGYSHLDTGEVSALLMSNNAPLANFHYDNFGRRDFQYLLNGAFSTRVHDPLDRLTRLTGNLAPPNNFTLDFSPNAASGIATSARDNDAYAWAGHYAVNRAYTTDGLNRYSAISSIAPNPTYDANGNLTSAGSTTYTYDVENRLVTASGGSSVTLTYDPLGRLSQIATAGGATRRFGYDGDALIDEFDGSGSVRRVYVHGPGVDEPMFWWDIPANTWGTLQADERGSIVAVVNNGGAAATINRYDEYGIPATTNAGAFQYTGQVWLPELGMYHYKARIYSPYLGRFLQTDPVGYQDQFNLYAYAGNDPVNRTDPDGRQISCPTPPCPDIPRMLPSVREATVAAAEPMTIREGAREAGAQVMVEKGDPSRVGEVRTGEAAGRPSRENPMQFRFNPISRSDRYKLGADAHAHPRQGRSDERDMNQRAAAERTNARNLYPSAQDYRHMNQTGAPFVLKNTEGALLEGYRVGNSDHLAIIRPGNTPLGPVPLDLSGLIVDPE